MPPQRPLSEVARLPAADDNTAIAVTPLDAGSRIATAQGELVLEHTVLEGHRFAVRPLERGEPLLSWGMPFGHALEPIAPGSYVCNRATLDELRERRLDFALPAAENFADMVTPFSLEGFPLAPAPPQVAVAADSPSFLGYPRSPDRGVGTRNCIVLLGTSSRAASYVRRLEGRLAAQARRAGLEDGVVAVAHTEGGTRELPNNAQLLLRTLAGFVVHPNVGAVLIVDDGSEAVGNAALRAFLLEADYPLAEVPHRFLTLSGDLEQDLRQGDEIVLGWLPEVAALKRQPVSAGRLKIALQCGGSDAFSGISGNPLAAWVAREAIRAGGSANLAETDELVGAERYLLQNVRDEGTARAFAAVVDRFRRWAERHGASVEGNPSGGNRFRGLYNIALKSLGAAMKRHPDVRLDQVIDYAEPMTRPGFTFMDSPGNDLESIAGQVASGANLILFVTGNGSITNFPFVPTIKIVTTTARFERLRHEMDVNAGSYLDGEPLDTLGRRTFGLTLEVAAGRRTAGERAGHAQVQIWRDWPLAERARGTDPQGATGAIGDGLGDGAPLVTRPPVAAVSTPQIRVLPTAGGTATERVALILPTSLCAGQIARMAADTLGGRLSDLADPPFDRVVALVHTEGCGHSPTAERLTVRTLLGYALHPSVAACIFLEHGCEMTHNDHFRLQLERAGADPSRFGWASIQQDGGIERVFGRLEAWFERAAEAQQLRPRTAADLGALRIGLAADGPVSAALAAALAETVQQIVSQGGTVVVPAEGPLADAPDFLERVLAEGWRTSLAYGQALQRPGFHLMDRPSPHWVETATGLGATGVEAIVVCLDRGPVQAHPLVPVVQLREALPDGGDDRGVPDLVLTPGGAAWEEQILTALAEVVSGERTPTLSPHGYSDFQLSRGRSGISL
jgi:altronate dehydratase